MKQSVTPIDELKLKLNQNSTESQQNGLDLSDNNEEIVSLKKIT